MSESIHEITWEVRHKHFMRLTQEDFADLARRLRLDEDVSNEDVLEALYESRHAEDVLADLADDSNWLDDGDANMLLDNRVRTKS